MIDPHQKKQLLYVGGAAAAVGGYLWWRGRSQAGLQYAPLPPVSGGYINTDPGSQSPTSQPVANLCPAGYINVGNSCGLLSAVQQNRIAQVIPGGYSTTIPSCTSAGCGAH